MSQDSNDSFDSEGNNAMDDNGLANGNAGAEYGKIKKPKRQNFPVKGHSQSRPNEGRGIKCSTLPRSRESGESFRTEVNDSVL